MSVVAGGCCCGEAEPTYMAFACFPNRSRSVIYSGANETTVFNGTLIDSTNPPAGTAAIVWMVGAGGGSRSSDVIGGAGCIVEKITTLPSSSTVKVGGGGHGADSIATASTVFGGGAKGATTTVGSIGKSYGGGATGWTGAGGIIAGGGGGSGSPEFFASYGSAANGGDAGVAAAQNACGLTGCGAAGGGATGTCSTGTAGAGSAGAVQVDPPSGGGAGGGGGGGGLDGGGGGTNTASPATNGGGGGAGGNSCGYTLASAQAGDNGLAQSNPITSSHGDGGIATQGDNGLWSIYWRKCSDCPCPEASSGLPPFLYICLTETQLLAIVAAASPCTYDGFGDYWITFRYLNYPYTINVNPFGGSYGIPSDRKCTRTVLTVDIDTTNSRYVSSVDDCCDITSASLYTELCTSACVDTCPDTIYLCGDYMESIGVPMCRDPSKTYIIEYAGCIFILGASGTNVQCDASEYSPMNVGAYGGEFEEEPVTYIYTVGPYLFSGGFFCCAGTTFDVATNWSGVQPVANGFGNCPDEHGGTPYAYPLCSLTGHNASGTFTLVCVNAGDFYFTNTHVCYPASDPCDCSSWPCGVDNNSTDPLGGGCNAVVDPCSSPKSDLATNFTVVQAAFPGDTLTTCMRLVRSTATIDPSWASVDTVTGTIYIDDCVFTGAGTGTQFAKKINDALEGCIVATGSDYWLGDRCCTADTTSCNECRGGSDNWELFSISSTAAVFKATYSQWFQAQVSVTYTERSCSFCFYEDDMWQTTCLCCGGDGYVCSASLVSQSVAEKYGVSSYGAAMNPLTVVSESCSHERDPIGEQGGGVPVIS